MITTVVKLRKQLMPTCNCFLLLEHIKKKQSCVDNILSELSKCKNADNISSSVCGPESVIPDSSPHVEEEILLYLDTTYNSEAASAKSGGNEAALSLSYKNRNIYNTNDECH